nr:MAG TPA: hypothetical protein [Caudoviricetes sp.]
MSLAISLITSCINVVLPVPALPVKVKYSPLEASAVFIKFSIAFLATS